MMREFLSLAYFKRMNVEDAFAICVDCERSLFVWMLSSHYINFSSQ